MFAKDIGIDLGTANILVFVKDKGVVLKEPAVVAIDNHTKEVLAVGVEARNMLGRTPGNIVAIRPLQDGVIADFDMTEAMLKHFIKKTIGMQHIFKPRIMICTPTNVTTVEQKAVKETAERCGGKEIFIMEEPKAAAIGAGLDIYEPSGNMVIDIGGGTTDVAVLSMGDVVTATSVKIAGDKFDEAIAKYIKDKYKLLIGERTSEEIKVTIGSVYPSENETMEIRGRDLVSGLPVIVTVTSDEIREALADSVSAIVQAAKSVLEKTPPELAADIIDKGIMLTGGGALLKGMDKLLIEELRVPVLIAEEPMECVVNGTKIALQNIDRLNRSQKRRGGLL